MKKDVRILKHIILVDCFHIACMSRWFILFQIGKSLGAVLPTPSFPPLLLRLTQSLRGGHMWLELDNLVSTLEFSKLTFPTLATQDVLSTFLPDAKTLIYCFSFNK